MIQPRVKKIEPITKLETGSKRVCIECGDEWRTGESHQCKIEKPQIPSLRPKYIADTDRQEEVKASILECLNMNYELNTEWIKEYNDLAEKSTVNKVGYRVYDDRKEEAKEIYTVKCQDCEVEETHTNPVTDYWHCLKCANEIVYGKKYKPPVMPETTKSTGTEQCKQCGLQTLTYETDKP